MRYRNRAYPLYVLLLCLLLDACGGSIHAPVATRTEDSRPGPVGSAQKPEQPEAVETEPAEIQPLQTQPVYHVVARGDTLYSIAWRYGHDHRDIAAWNNISHPFVIYPGQYIRLQPLPQFEARPPTPGPIAGKRTTARPEVTDKKPDGKPPPALDEKLTGTSTPIRWSWPTQGSIIKSDSPISKKGVDIGGQTGQKIAAAASGEVVYSGSGLKGYGRLIIIKHDATYLSAYAHNSRLMVNEGDWVTGGQQIAQMGQTSNGRTMLHFEIRKNGQPEDPLNYLPEL